MNDQRLSKKLTGHTLGAILASVIIFFFTCCGTDQDENVLLKHSSGDEEIDQVRREVKHHPTDENNYINRGILLRFWESSLRHRGAITAGRFTQVDDNILNVASIKNKKEQREEIARYASLIDRGYLVLDSIQNEIMEDPSKGIRPLSPDPESVSAPVITEKPWPQYQGTLTNTGFNGTDGPVYGRVAWDFPVGLAWESRPVVEGDQVHLVSPGMRIIHYTLDINTGEVVNTVKQLSTVSEYRTPAYASTPVLLRDYILMREMGSKDNAKDIAYIRRNAREVEKTTYAGHVDYRAGYAPLAANEKYIVYPFSFNDIEATPPEAQAFNHIICKDTKTGEQLRDVHVGHTFAEPLLEDDRVYIGTKNGYVYCFNAALPYKETEVSDQIAMAREQKVTWKFKAGDAVNRRVATDAKQVYFGANDGSVYSLDKENGDLIWKYSVDKPVEESFRHFSTPLVSDGRVFIGSADKYLYCLDATSGALLFKHASSDWVRACPVATETNVYFASIDGKLYNIDFSEGQPEEVWEKRIGDHWIYTDLAMSGDKLLVNDSDLYTYCINTADGDILWRFSIIKSFHQEDGYRILTDNIAGGGYYQSKATAANGKVYIGTPSRFVYSLDAETGEEIWKHELGAAISGAPVIDNGKIYIGQQGGEDDFYCLDAESGKLIWKQNVGWVWGSATVSDGLVFIPGIDGYVICLDADKGHMIWRFRTDRSTCSEALVIGDHVYFGSWDSFLYKFEKRTGKLVWKFAGGGSDSGIAIAFEGKILSPGGGTGGKGLKCIDAETAEILWKPELTGSTNATPAYHDGQIYVPLRVGRIIALDPSNGKKIWSYHGPGFSAPVVGNNGYVYCGSGNYPYFYALNEKGNGDGTTDCLFRVRMANGLLESTPALYRGRAYILSAGGFLYAIE